MRRIGITAAALVCAGAALGAADTHEAATPSAARTLVEEKCAGCHPGAQLDALVAARVGKRDPKLALDGFLAKHHVPDAALRAEVIELLAGRLAGR